MIVLKDVLSPLEWRITMSILKTTKTMFGQDDYYLFKKMVMVVGFIHGLEGYATYKEFINSACNLVTYDKVSPINTFAFHARSMTASFFGVNKKHILESTLEEIRDEMASKRLQMLELEKIIPFQLKQGY